MNAHLHKQDTTKEAEGRINTCMILIEPRLNISLFTLVMDLYEGYIHHHTRSKPERCGENSSGRSFDERGEEDDRGTDTGRGARREDQGEGNAYIAGYDGCHGDLDQGWMPK